MRKLLPLFLLVGACAAVSPMVARAQQDEAPSLGDVARKARQQKQQQQPADVQQKPAQAAADAQSPASAAATQSAGATKDAASKDGKATTTADTSTKAALKSKKVITNEEIPEHVGPTRTAAPASTEDGSEDGEAQESEGKAPPDYWRTRILSEKNAIAALKSDIQSLSASIQYAGGNCVSGCVQWNERQQQKQQQVEAMKAQLEQQEKTLDDMQEMARKQGYGSSVYDP